MIVEIIDLDTILMKTPNSVCLRSSQYIYQPAIIFITQFAEYDRTWQDLACAELDPAMLTACNMMCWTESHACMLFKKYNFLNGEPKQPYKKV